MANMNSFERMASGLSNEERQKILERLTSSTQTQEDQAISPVNENIDSSNTPFQEQIKKESMFLRFILWIKSVFTSTPEETLYNEHKLNALARSVEKNFPGLLDSRKNVLLNDFYARLEELQGAAACLKPYLLAAEDDEGAFYVVLSSLIMPEITAAMNEEVDPYATEITSSAKPELRVELLRKMDEIFDSIAQQDKSKMYEAVKATLWLNNFVKLPFVNFLNKFSTITDGVCTCQISSIENEINQFAKILGTQFIISDSLLQALYLFSAKKASVNPEQSSENEASQFLEKAHASISKLHMFMNSVPLQSLGCLVYSDIHWQKQPFGGAEDWFIQYKAAWKKIFEQKWTSWAKDCQKESLKYNLKNIYQLNDFPSLPQRPWTQLWGGVHFRYELTAGFLFWFLTKHFHEYEIALKTLLSEGIFRKRESQKTYTEAFNNIIQISINFETLVHQCAPNGEFGILFTKLQEEHLKTLTAQSKVEQTLRRVESDFESILHGYNDSCKIMDKILDSVLGISRDSRTDGIENLNRLMGKDNEKFIKTLKAAKETLLNTQSLLLQLEELDMKQTRF